MADVCECWCICACGDCIILHAFPCTCKYDCASGCTCVTLFSLVLFVGTWNPSLSLSFLKLLIVFITLSQFMSTMYRETPWACRDQALLNAIIHLWPPCRDVPGIGLSEKAGEWSSLMQNPVTFPTPTPPSTLMSHICKVWDERFLVRPHQHDSY